MTKKSLSDHISWGCVDKRYQTPARQTDKHGGKKKRSQKGQNSLGLRRVHRFSQKLRMGSDLTEPEIYLLWSWNLILDQQRSLSCSFTNIQHNVFICILYFINFIFHPDCFCEPALVVSGSPFWHSAAVRLNTVFQQGQSEVKKILKLNECAATFSSVTIESGRQPVTSTLIWCRVECRDGCFTSDRIKERGVGGWVHSHDCVWNRRLHRDP